MLEQLTCNFRVIAQLEQERILFIADDPTLDLVYDWICKSALGDSAIVDGVKFYYYHAIIMEDGEDEEDVLDEFIEAKEYWADF